MHEYWLLPATLFEHRDWVHVEGLGGSLRQTVAHLSNAVLQGCIDTLAGQ